MAIPKFDEHGNMELNPSYKEIRKLCAMLKASHIPHDTERIMDGWHIWYPSKDDRVVSVIEHYGSYGHEFDMLEIMGLLTPEEEERDSVAGWLSAENVYDRIAYHYWTQFIVRACAKCTTVLNELHPNRITNIHYEHVDASGYWFSYDLRNGDKTERLNYVVRHHEIIRDGGR